MEKMDSESIASRNTSSEEDGKEGRSIAESVEITVSPPRHKSVDDLLKGGNPLGSEMLDKVLQVSSNMIYPQKNEKSQDRKAAGVVQVDVLENVEKVLSNEDIVSNIPQDIPMISTDSPIGNGNIPELHKTPEPQAGGSTPELGSKMEKLDVKATSSSKEKIAKDLKDVKSNQALSSQNLKSPTLVPILNVVADRFDTYGFLLRDDMAEYPAIKIDKSIEAQWTANLTNWNKKKKNKKMKKLVRIGVPNSVRGEVWSKLVGMDIDFKPLIFTELTTRPANDMYEVIDRDIGRCYPEHQKFRDDAGREQLQSILRAFTHLHPEIGYCQGMGRLVGLLLMRMEPENAFWTFNAIIQKYIPNLYLPSLVQMRVDALVFEKLINRKMPKLYRHLKAYDLHALTYTTQWFMTLYTMALPWPTVLRVWDIFLFEGEKAIFKIGLAVLECCKGTFKLM